MNVFSRGCIGFLLLIGVMGCAVTSSKPAAVSSQTTAPLLPGYQIGAPDVWGGDVRCSSAGCLLALIEHENAVLSIYRLQRTGAQLLDKHVLPYHPDAAVWVNDHLIAAAVESTQSIHIFEFTDKLTERARFPVGFQPRNVVLMQSAQGRHQLVATPYSGATVAVIAFDEHAIDQATVQPDKWCRAPWNPVRVKHYPPSSAAGIVAACRDDQRIIAKPDDHTHGATTQLLAQFSAVPSMVAPTLAGDWLYVAFETGGKNLRIRSDTGEQQWLPASPEGSVAVTVLSDDTVIWAEDSKIKLQKIELDGTIVETRWYPTSGFSTKLQLIDIDSDGEDDLVILNSSGENSDVIFGPLWNGARKLAH